MTAANLAAATGGEPVSVRQSQYLTFTLGGELFAFGILAVKEIIEYGAITPVPMMPECIRGVINLRGAVVPVLDLSIRFGRKRSEPGRRSCIIIVEADTGELRHEIGVIVDAVNAVQDIPDSDIEPAPAFGARLRPDFICGMGKVAGHFVILLNIDKALSADELGAMSGGGHALEPTQAAH